MYFKDCLQKNIQVRVKDFYFQASDFTLVYTLPNHPKKMTHLKFCRYFNFRKENVDGFFDGGSFDGKSAYRQIVVDLKIAISLIHQEQGSRRLLEVLDNLLTDLKMMPLGELVA